MSTITVMMIVMVVMGSMMSCMPGRPGREQGAALSPSEREPEQHDHAIGAELENTHGLVHRLRGGAEHERRNPHQRNRRDGLRDRGREGEHDPAFHRRVVGDEIGRDHRLAVAGPRRVKNPVEKR